VGLGAGVLPDLGGGDLNLAVALAADLLTAPEVGVVVAVLPADLPGLVAADLDVALAEAASHRRAFLADADGTGTTLLTARAGHPLRSRYGRHPCGSRRAHEALPEKPHVGPPNA
jgi:2-phospho-L-lactate guanylyltransferase